MAILSHGIIKDRSAVPESEIEQQASLNAHVAQLIYDARTEAGLSQAELAALIGTTQWALLGFVGEM